MKDYKFYKGFHLDLWELNGYLPHDPLILFQDCRGKQKLNLTVTPSFENLVRRSCKENTGNENICVKNNLHLRPRTLATAASTSAFLNPALRACFLAWPSRSLNSLTEGAEIAFRITPSRFPTTTNCVPAFKPNRSRISSGMTTCPLDDIRVVAKLSIDTSFLTSKIISWFRRSVNKYVLIRPGSPTPWIYPSSLFLKGAFSGGKCPSKPYFDA
jgi:hypothetical protein